jgi:DNA-nicking Smr family endonuclease
MSDDDSKLFQQAMDDVKPIKKAAKVLLNKQDSSALAQQARRKAATTALSKDNNPLGDHLIELLDPYYPLEFRRSGVQYGVVKKLKQGKYLIEAELDLHKMTVERASREVFDFITEASRYDLRNVMIVHGKGSHGDASFHGNTAKLKSYVNQWLPELKPVQAFCSAQPRDGGLGAAYVQLKKSDKKKQQNRERISRGHLS